MSYYTMHTVLELIFLAQKFKNDNNEVITKCGFLPFKQIDIRIYFRISREIVSIYFTKNLCECHGMLALRNHLAHRIQQSIPNLKFTHFLTNQIVFALKTITN